MTKKFNQHILLSVFLILFGTVFFLTGREVFGQGKQNAPGQIKKQESSVVVGSVDEVTGNTIQIEEKGKKKEVTLDKNTKVVGKDNKPVKLGAIKVKDVIALVGNKGETATETGKFKIKKVFVQEASNSAQMKRRAVQGVITDIAGSVLTLAHQVHRDRIYTVTVSDTTLIKIKEASGSATLATLAVGQRIVVVGDLNETGGILAQRIHVIPGKATGIFKKQPVATPSASITTTATPSATPTNTATPSATPTSSLPEETPTPTLTL